MADTRWSLWGHSQHTLLKGPPNQAGICRNQDNMRRSRVFHYMNKSKL